MQNMYLYESEELVVLSEKPNNFKQIMDELNTYEMSSVSYELGV